MATWEEDFAKWNFDNLETLSAMPVPDSDIIMVHLDHPVVGLLNKKFAEFGCHAHRPAKPNSKLATNPAACIFKGMPVAARQYS